jgi:hypothetical protein
VTVDDITVAARELERQNIARELALHADEIELVQRIYEGA